MRSAELEAVANPKRDGSGHACGATSIGRQGSTPQTEEGARTREPRPYATKVAGMHRYGRGLPIVGTRLRSVAGTTTVSSGVTSTWASA
jgi:hypothetical protein